MENISRYLHLTREVMPQRAREVGKAWPVREDHCFQRIVLDTVAGGRWQVAGGRWYDHIARPAYKHLTPKQATQAVALCEAILEGRQTFGR